MKKIHTGDEPSNSDLDLLLSRLLDRKATPEEWQIFDELEERRPELATDLVHLLRADSLLGLGLERELAQLGAEAAAVAPQVWPSAPASATRGRADEQRAAAGWTTWSGWVAAAALALALLGTRLAAPDAPGVEHADPQNQVASTEGTEPTASETQGSETELTATGSESRVLEELPLVVLDTRPAEGGDGYQVTVLRQVLESRRVDKLLGVARDEEGRPAPVVIDPAVIAPPTIL